jgi:hypothetical protein
MALPLFFQNCVLIIDICLHILIPLEDLVMLTLPNLESLLHLSVLFLDCSVHLVLLTGHLDSLCCQDLLTNTVHELLLLSALKLASHFLKLVGSLIIHLLSMMRLHLAEVEQLG